MGRPGRGPERADRRGRAGYETGVMVGYTSTTSSIDPRGRSTIDVFMRSAQVDLQCSVLEAKEPAAPRLAVVNMCGCLSCHLRVIATRGRFYSGDISILNYYLHEWLALQQPIYHPRVLPAIHQRLVLGGCWIRSPLLFAVRNPVGCHASPQRLKANAQGARLVLYSFSRAETEFVVSSARVWSKKCQHSPKFRNGRVWATRCGGCASFSEPMGVTDRSPPPLATPALPLTLWRPPQTSHSLRTLPRHPSAP